MNIQTSSQFTRHPNADAIIAYVNDTSLPVFYWHSDRLEWVQTGKPNWELRRAKKMVHAVFDPIWKKRLEEKSKTNPNYKKVHARGGRYKKLAEALGIPSSECHIGMFDVLTCWEAIRVCKSGVLNQ